jgi:hypothetical protein
MLRGVALADNDVQRVAQHTARQLLNLLRNNVM